MMSSVVRNGESEKNWNYGEAYKQCCSIGTLQVQSEGNDEYICVLGLIGCFQETLIQVIMYIYTWPVWALRNGIGLFSCSMTPKHLTVDGPEHDVGGIK